MKKRSSQWGFKLLADIDLEYCHVDDEFDEVNYESLTENYSRNQRSKTDETEYRYA